MPPRLNLPPITRALLAFLLCLSALNVSLRFHKWRAAQAGTTDENGTVTIPGEALSYLSSPRWAIPYLVIVPAYSLRFPWTFLTAALVENNFVSLAVSGVVVWFGGRYLERAWGGREFAKFMVFVAVIPNVVAFGVYVFWHAVTRTPLFPTPIQGLVAVEAGFLVALKQLVPEHTVSLFAGLLRIRVKHFPAIFTLANILSGPLLGTDTAFWLSLTGFLTSWIHLRFFRVTEIPSTMTASTGGENVKLQGDASETFAFAAFFPDFVRPFVEPVADGVYNLLVAIKVCVPFSDEAVVAGNESAAARRAEGLPSFGGSGAGAGAGGVGGGGGRRAEAERRRALALKALDQRLNAESAANAATVGNSANAVPPRVASEAVVAPAVVDAAPTEAAVAEAAKSMEVQREGEQV